MKNMNATPESNLTRCAMWQSLILYFSRATSLDNRISDLQRDELQSLSGSLKSLDLSGNSLTSVPEGIFWNLQRLEILKLARNNIIQIHSMAFQNGVSSFLMILFKFKVFDKPCRIITLQ
jgi:Leucine-rich repeat (LRR) protein